MTDPLARYVHDLFETDALGAIEAYTRVPCLSPDFDADWEAHGHLAAAAQSLCDWAAARRIEGVRAQVVTLPGATPVVVVDAPATGGAQGTVLVYGHFDKQPPMGEWRAGLGPFTPVREGDRLYGRGTADDGYALFAATGAIEALDAQGIARPRTVVLVEGSEESGSPDLPAYLDALGGRIGRPDLMVCLDSGCLSYDRLWLTTSLRGNIIMTVRVDVLSEGVHSGSAGAIVPTSFRILRVLLDRVEDARTGELGPGVLHATPPPNAPDAGAWDAMEVFPVVEGLALEGGTDAERLVRRAWAPSLSVTGMDGIPAVRDGGNVLRPSTTAKLSVRLPPTVDADEAAAALSALLSADPPHGAHVEVHVENAADGWAAPPLEPWVADAFGAASEELFGAPFGTLGEGGTIPFLAMLSERFAGVPFLATGVLGPASNAHGPNEFLHLPMAEAVTVATARLIVAAGAARRDR